MSEAEFEAFDERWSRKHMGRHWGRFPLLSYHDGMACVDMLHAFINDTNDALSEGFQSHLTEEHTDKALKALQAKIIAELNTRIKGWKGRGGAN
eukprot:3659482-Prymnesium_polylepis.1